MLELTIENLIMKISKSIENPYEQERKNKERREVQKNKKEEILYLIAGQYHPGTLKRNPSSFTQTPKERWEEIIDICADVISESGLE